MREAIAKTGEDSARTVAAQEALAAARRRQASATDAVSAATTRLKSAQGAARDAVAQMSAETVRSSGGLRQLFTNFNAGARDAKAAKSAFTGVSGSIAGILRAASDITGLTHFGRLLKLTAQQAGQKFTSLASMVGGGVARAALAAGRGMSRLGKYVGAAFAPMGQYALAAGTVLASPFVKLGTRVASWLSPVTAQVSGLFSKIGAAAGPAASNLVSRFTSGLSGIGGKAASALGSVVTAAAGVGSRAGQALGNAFKGAATVAVTAGAAALGVALGAGFSRLTAIDGARAKLTGLGHDGQSVAAIMKDATASVKGTAFGLGEAANVAAGAVAAQIKPGKELESHLKRVANNASAAGMSMEEMGSIFNKAVTQANGVQNDVIGQLADKGIPIYAELGKQMGVTAGEVFKLASEGKVDFETFSKAAEAAAGTVADEMGKTVPGAFKNLKASLGRIGANLFGGIDESGEMFGLYAKLGPLIASATSALGPVEKMATSAGKALDSTLGPALELVTTLFEKIGSGASDLKSKFAGLSPLIAPIGAAFAALGAGGLAGLLSRIPLLGGMLGGLTGPLAALGGPLGIAAAALAGFALSGADASGLVSGLEGIIDQFVIGLGGLVGKATELIPKIVETITGILPELVTAAVGIVGALADGIVASVPLLVTGALNLLDGLMTAIIDALPLLTHLAVTVVNGLVSGLITAAPALVQGAVSLVTGLIQGIVEALPLLIEGALTLVSALLTAIVANLPLIIEGGVQLLTSLIQGIITAIPLLIEGALLLVMGLLTAIIDNLPLIIAGGIELILALIAGIVTLLPQLIVAGIDLVVALITGLIEAIPQIIEMLPQIVSAIWDGLKNVDWLDLGAQIIQGVIDGFFSMVGAVGDAVGSIVQTITDFFPHSPAKRGPLSGAGWYRLKDSGGAMIGQFNDGALAGASEFEDTMTAMAQSATQKAQAVMGSASATMTVEGRGQAAVAAGPVQQYNNFAHEDPEVALELAKRKLAGLFGGG